MYIDNMRIYKILCYIVIFIIILILFYYFYLYIGSKFTENFSLGDDAILLNKYTADDDVGKLELVDASYPENVMDKREQDQFFQFVDRPDSFYYNSSGTTPPFWDSYFSLPYILRPQYVNYRNASDVLQCPPIHSINLKNYIIKNMKADFKIYDASFSTSEIYNTFYKINFWYNINRILFLDDTVLSDMSKENYGFDYVSLIYPPSNNNYKMAMISSDYTNYINNYRSYLDYKFSYFDNDDNNLRGKFSTKYMEFIKKSMKFIYDVEIRKPESSNFDFAVDSNNFPPVFKYSDKFNYFEYIDLFKKPDTVNTKENFGNLTNNCIKNILVNAVQYESTDFNSVIGEEFIDDNSGNLINTVMNNFMNHFIVENALVALIAERNMYGDVNYGGGGSFSSSDNIILNYKDGNFAGGETFSTNTEFISKQKEMYKDAISDWNEGTSNKDTTFDIDPNELYIYSRSPVDVDLKSTPISKLYRTTTYKIAIDYITDFVPITTQPKTTDGSYKTNKDYISAVQNLIDIKKNIAIRTFLNSNTLWDNYSNENSNKTYTISDIDTNPDTQSFTFDPMTLTIDQMLPYYLSRLSGGDKKGSFNYGLGGHTLPKETTAFTNNDLGHLGTELIDRSNPVGYDALWIYYSVRYAFNLNIAAGLSSYNNVKGTLDVDYSNLAKLQVAMFMNDINKGLSGRSSGYYKYYQYYLNDPNEDDAYTLSHGALINDVNGNMLSDKMKNELSKIKALEAANTPTPAEDVYIKYLTSYNNFYDSLINNLQNQTVSLFKGDFLKIDQVNETMEYLKEIMLTNKKLEGRINSIATNKLLSILDLTNKNFNYNNVLLVKANVDSYNTAETSSSATKYISGKSYSISKEEDPVLFKYENFEIFYSFNEPSINITPDDYNITDIRAFMPVMVYFSTIDLNAKSTSTPGSDKNANSQNVYSDVDDFEYYSKQETKYDGDDKSSIGNNLFLICARKYLEYCVSDLINKVTGIMGSFQPNLDETLIQAFLSKYNFNIFLKNKNTADIANTWKTLKALVSKQIDTDNEYIRKIDNSLKAVTTAKDSIRPNTPIKERERIVKEYNKYYNIYNELVSYQQVETSVANTFLTKIDPLIEKIIEFKNLQNSLEKAGNVLPKSQNYSEWLDSSFNELTNRFCVYTLFNNVILSNFFGSNPNVNKNDCYYVKDITNYEDIYNHPKMMLVYSTGKYGDSAFPYKIGLDLGFRKVVKDFCVFDIGILLRHIFKSDLKSYLAGTNVYSNFNFMEWFEYDINNIVTISSGDPLSDENFSSLTLNSKINNFFSKMGNSYKNFRTSLKKTDYNAGTSIDYFDFAAEESQIYQEILSGLLKFINSDICVSNKLNDMLRFSYTNSFTSSANCLCDMYNNDLNYIIVPLFQQLVSIDQLILKPLNDKTFGDENTFKKINGSINNGSYLNENSYFIEFYQGIYNDTFSKLNQGMAFGSNAPDPSKEYLDNFKPTESGAITYMLNIHNLLLNLIFRAFYYYKRITDLIKKTDPACMNNFDDFFNKSIYLKTDPPTALDISKYFLDNANHEILKSPQIVLFSTYQNNFFKFIYNALNFYKKNISSYCYNHIKIGYAKINYDLQNTIHYSYQNTNTNISIQKGQILQQNFILFEQMLNAVKNGEAYISTVEKVYGFIGKVSEDPRYTWIKPDISSTGFWSVSADKISNLSLEYYNPIFNEISSSINNYFNTVFYFDNSRLYGCFDGGLSNYFSRMGTSSSVSTTPGGNIIKTNSNEPTLISHVNNLDTSGNISKHGAIVNCINDTVAYNRLVNNASSDSDSKFDIVSIVPYNKSKTSTPGAELDTYSCYAGKSKNFEKKKPGESLPVPLTVSEMDRCKISYTDNSGNIDPKFNENLKNTSIIYKLDTTTIYDSSNVVFLGCFARNIPEMGIYNTLPHFIGTLSGSEFYKNPIDIVNSFDKLVTQYNTDMGTNFDIFGITSNLSDTLSLDCYAGTLAFDAKYAMTVKKGPYEENCNIYYPGNDNFMVFQDVIHVTNPCVTTELSNVQKYNDQLTTYLNNNITNQQKAINQIGSDINLLNNIFPIKFSVSAIANTKDSADITVDISESTGFEISNNSLPICSLQLKVKEGPPGKKGDTGPRGKQGTNTKGVVGDVGNMGYWGTSNT